MSYKNETFEKTVKNITKMILTNPQKMVREEDLKNLSNEFNFEQIISNVYLNLQNVGFEFISTMFLDQKYYILISDGKDDDLTPSQYGILALIAALGKEIDENLYVDELKEFFSQVWETDINFLLENDYLRIIEDLGVIKITPLGKALLKNIIKDIQLKNLLDLFENK